MVVISTVIAVVLGTCRSLPHSDSEPQPFLQRTREGLRYARTNRIARVLFGVPAVKGVEFGAGFAVSKMRGSENNDPYRMAGDGVRICSNHAGGILGGITTGLPIIVRAAIKPTPSISKKQKTVDMSTMEETEIEINGRHDAAIAARAAVIIDSVTAICVCDLFTKRFGNDWATE